MTEHERELLDRINRDKKNWGEEIVFWAALICISIIISMFINTVL